MGTRAEQRNYIPERHRRIVRRLEAGEHPLSVAASEGVSRQRIYVIWQRFRNIRDGKR